MKYLFANWKMYLDFDESMVLINQVLKNLRELDDTELAIFPNTLAITEVIKACQDTGIKVGAQTTNWTPRGAYTGAVSASLFAGVGCQYALVGHSERRYIFGETNEDARKKMEACIDAGITPVLCVGETHEDKEEGKETYRIKKQLMKALDGLEINSDLFIAYEPVWAVGTGENCDPAIASEHVDLIRTEAKQYTNAKIHVLYGGSVNADNMLSYLSHSAIDGVLVGGASAKYDTFSKMINTVSIT